MFMEKFIKILVRICIVLWLLVAIFCALLVLSVPIAELLGL